MGYDNRFKLEVHGESQEVEVSVCNECGFVGEGKFCQECGTKMDTEMRKVPFDSFEIISKFVNSSDEAGFLLDEFGGTCEPGSGYDFEKEVAKYSKKYPGVLFELFCDWDSGFGEPPTKWYIKNGKIQTCKATYTFPEFDESEME